MGPCILTAPALTPPLPPDHASVPRQGTGLPQRKLTPPASCGGPPYTPHTPQGSWGGGQRESCTWAVPQPWQAPSEGYVNLCITCQFRSGLAAR